MLESYRPNATTPSILQDEDRFFCKGKADVQPAGQTVEKQLLLYGQFR